MSHKYKTSTVFGFLPRDTQVHQALGRVGRGNAEGCVAVIHLNSHSVGQQCKEKGSVKRRRTEVDGSETEQPKQDQRTIVTLEKLSCAIDNGTCIKEAIYWHNRDGEFTEAHPFSADMYTSHMLPEKCDECNVCDPGREEFMHIPFAAELARQRAAARQAKREQKRNEKPPDRKKWVDTIKLFECRIQGLLDRQFAKGRRYESLQRHFSIQARDFIFENGFSTKTVLFGVRHARQLADPEQSGLALAEARIARASLLSGWFNVEVYGDLLMQCMQESGVEFRGEQQPVHQRKRCTCKAKEGKGQCSTACGCAKREEECWEMCKCEGKCGRRASE